MKGYENKIFRNSSYWLLSAYYVPGTVRLFNTDELQALPQF